MTVTSRRAAARTFAMTLGSLVAASPAFARAGNIDGADTAWMIVATAIVLMMTIPGIALFYAGMVRKKNVLATMAQSPAATALVSILWTAFGYSLAFTGDGAWLGSTDRLFLRGLEMDSISALAKTIPEALFMLYQMTFAIITVALVAGAVADRMRFSACFHDIFRAVAGICLCADCPLGLGGGFLGSAGVLDFARGTGSAGLASTGGSALGANSRAVMAIASTHLAACAGALTWMAIEWWSRGKPSVLGMVSGAVAGLGTITPASGFVLPWHGIVIGMAAGGICFYACTAVKSIYKYDDSLDVASTVLAGSPAPYCAVCLRPPHCRFRPRPRSAIQAFSKATPHGR
jgi:Amt family ammonium transporter